MTRVIAVASQKGGVGKTSLTQNLGAELVRAGRRVLLVDFDPQSNLTSGWGLDPGADRNTIYTAMLHPEQAQDCVIHKRPNLDLLPANLDLAGAELQFMGAVDRNIKLQDALTPLLDAYEYVLIDGPPSLGFFTVNALVAADEVLIPLQCQVYAYKAIDQLLTIIEQVRKLHPPLTVTGIVLTMYDVRNSLTISVEENARKRFGDLVYKTAIPVNVRIAESPLTGTSIGDYDPLSRGAKAYQALAKEIIDRGKKSERPQRKAGR
jgi:chromosome partitioning protein